MENAWHPKSRPDRLTGTIKAISRIPSIALTGKRPLGVITAGIGITWF